MIVRMSDLPNNVMGRVAPSYEVWVKLCGNHGVSILEKAERLDFVIINNKPWADWAPYSYKCVRCKYVWVSNYLHSKHEEYGKLPVTCPRCNNIYWYKEARFKREATTGTAKPGRIWKDTEIYHQVKEVPQ